MRGKLDEEGIQIAEFREEAILNRKRLAEATREFKKLHAGSEADPTTTLASKALGSLLKNYQEEIDRLTKRAKSSESAFLDLYQRLTDAPDPGPALSAAYETASRAAELDAQLRKVTQELIEYKEESKQIKNQDLTIRKLEDKIRLLEAQADERDRDAKQAQAIAAAEADASRTALMEAREGELTSALTSAEASLVKLQKLHHDSQNQLFTIQSETDEEKVKRQTELEFASSELERAQERLTFLEKEKEVLARQLAEIREESSATTLDAGREKVLSNSKIEESLRSDLEIQRLVVLRLRSEVATLKRDLDETNRVWDSRLEGVRSNLQASEAHARALEQELAMRPSLQQMEALRGQVRVLQAVGYNSLSVDDASEESEWEGQPSTNNGRGAISTGGGHLQQPGALEMALLQKNRHLESALTMSRLQVVEKSQGLDAALARVDELSEKLTEKLRLIKQLEEDFASKGGKWGKEEGKNSNSIPSLVDEGGGRGEEADEGGAESSSVLRVLCSQRDRFRTKVNDLEEEVANCKSELSALKSEAATAKADNVALVERMRYVSAFRGNGKAAHGGEDVESGSASQVEKKYGKIYEDQINPFREFQGLQKERQKQKMGVADRAMYKFGKSGGVRDD